MRRLLFLLALLPAALLAQTITIDPNAYVYTNQNCPTPLIGTAVVYGTTTGLVAGTDSVDVYVDFGDGNDSLKRVPVYVNSAINQGFGLNVQHTYTTPGIYSMTYIAYIPSVTSDTLSLPSSVIATNTCNNLSGTIYRDNNSNCTFDAGDIGVSAFVPLKIQVQNGSGGIWAYPNANGYYLTSVLAGQTYEVTSTINFPNLPFSCSQTNPAVFTATGNDVVDFPLAPVTEVRALSFTDSVGSRCYGNGLVYFGGEVAIYGDGSAPALQIYAAFGDGNDTTFTRNLGGSIFENPYLWLQHYYAAPGNYSLLLAVTEPVSGATDTLILYNDVELSDSCGNITGNVFLDLNTSCAFDAGDDTLPAAYVVLYQNNQYVAGDYAGTSGGYSFTVPPGTYTVSLGNYVNSYGYSMTCSSTPTRTVTLAASGSATEDFGLTCGSGVGDAEAILSGWGARPGQQMTLYPYVSALSCVPQSGTVTLVLDGMTTYAGSCDSTTLPTVNGNTLTWTYSNLLPSNYYWYWSHFLSCVILNVDSSAQIGDTLCFTLYITPSPADADQSNDTAHFCIAVRNSYDPNMKEVSPNGIAGNGHVAPNTEMTYTIHFQNTGNDVAFNIAITDTIDPSLDLATLQIIGSSHAVDPDIVGNNVLRFNFYNINLPDSASDEPNSHGWVKYRILQDQWLPNGTPIDNTAYIYFDFNEPIVTNTTNTIVDWALSINEVPIGDGLNVYPVPANEQLTITSETTLNGTITLRDVTGREVKAGVISGKQAQLYTGDLANGVYIIAIAAEGKTILQKVIVQH